MRLMHTKLPEFLDKMNAANDKHLPKSRLTIRGMENLRTVKMQSLRTGRLEKEVEEIASSEGIDHVELVMMPRVPETMHTVVIKGMGKDGTVKKAILDTINVLHPTEEAELIGCEEIDDRRPRSGNTRRV